MSTCIQILYEPNILYVKHIKLNSWPSLIVILNVGAILRYHNSWNIDWTKQSEALQLQEESLLITPTLNDKLNFFVL